MALLFTKQKYSSSNQILKAEYWEGREDQEDGPYYFVHYRGWKSKFLLLTRWDEWVPGSRILELNQQNQEKQQQLLLDFQQSKQTTTTTSTTAKVVDQPPNKEKKRRRESLASKEGDFLKKPEIQIAIPDSLKTQLVEEWENVTKNKKLMKLPAKMTVKELLSKFYEEFKFPFVT